MANYEMLVTDVTCYGPRFCVAGWDLARGVMVRPEPPGANIGYEPSRFWENAYAGPGRPFDVGNVVSFQGDPPPAAFPYPHATEDILVTPGTQLTVVATHPLADIPNIVGAGISQGIHGAFDGGLTRLANGKACVPHAYKGRSLGAIDVDPGSITFHEYQFWDKPVKLRALIDEAGLRYDLGVTGAGLLAQWRQGGVPALKAALGSSAAAHVRLGLSRPFPARPDECYAQVNGLILL